MDDEPPIQPVRRRLTIELADALPSKRGRSRSRSRSRSPSRRRQQYRKTVLPARDRPLRRERDGEADDYFTVELTSSPIDASGSPAPVYSNKNLYDNQPRRLIIRPFSRDDGRSDSDEEDDNLLYNHAQVSAGSLLLDLAVSEARESSAESTSTPMQFRPPTGNAGQLSGTVMHVYESKYTGEARQDGTHTARLSLLHAPGQSRQPRQALFRWIHIEQPVLDFEEFSQIANSAALSDVEKTAIRKLLNDVRKRDIKTVKTAHGSHKHLRPRILIHQQQADEAAGPQGAPFRPVCWINLPFFHLKIYSSDPPRPASFQDQTLMQAGYSQNTKMRDMQQAVRQADDVEKDACFHISQAWFIIINNTLLVSCSSLSVEALRETLIETTRLPPLGESSDESNRARILVAYGGNVLWTIPLYECRTWFAFVIHFWEFWPENIVFFRAKRLLHPEDWPYIVELALRPDTQIELNACIHPLPSPPMRGKLIKSEKAPCDTRNMTSERAPSATNANPQPAGPSHVRNEKKAALTGEPIDTSFSIIMWLIPGRGLPRTETVQAELRRVDLLLRQKTQRSNQYLYLECPESSYREVRSALQHLVEERAFLGLKESSRVRIALEERIDVFNAATIIFQYFLPLHFSSYTVGKFWGALEQMMDWPWPGKEEEENPVLAFSKRQRISISNISGVRRCFRSLSRHIQLFNNIVSQAEKAKRSTDQILEDVLRSWMHLILALAQGSVDPETHRSHLDRARYRIQTGMSGTLRLLGASDLLTKSSVLPTELLSIISHKLLNDVTGRPESISKIYLDYISLLDHEIEKNPALSHQERIERLISETKVIKDVLSQQNDIFTSIAGLICPSSRVAGARKDEHRTHATGRDRYETDNYAGRDRKDDRRRDDRRDEWRPTRQPGQGSYGEDPASRRTTRVRYGELVLARRSYPITEEDNPIPRFRSYHQDEAASVYSDKGGYGAALFESPKLSSTDANGFRELLATECLSVVAQRLREFRDIEMHAGNLSRMNADRAATRKDALEQAIYAFTIVTVIFLPLSAVAGIFGMNTSDIRNLESGQWLYWATAVPVTALVVLGGLWWMGELGNTFAWLLNKRQSWLSRRPRPELWLPPPPQQQAWRP